MIKTYKYDDQSYGEVFSRKEQKSTVTDVVADIIDNVKKEGDKAIFDYVERFDNVKLDSLIVS